MVSINKDKDEKKTAEQEMIRIVLETPTEELVNNSMENFSALLAASLVSNDATLGVMLRATLRQTIKCVKKECTIASFMVAMCNVTTTVLMLVAELRLTNQRLDKIEKQLAEQGELNKLINERDIARDEANQHKFKHLQRQINERGSN